MATARAGIEPTQSAEHSLASPADLCHFDTNPIPRPAAIAGVGRIYDVQQTSWGQTLASKLGPNSGFFLELAAWAPITSYMFDATATQCLILGAPDTPPEVRKAFAGVTDALLEILDAALHHIHFHSLRANQGAQFVDAYQT